MYFQFLTQDVSRASRYVDFLENLGALNPLFYHHVPCQNGHFAGMLFLIFRPTNVCHNMHVETGAHAMFAERYPRLQSLSRTHLLWLVFFPQKPEPSRQTQVGYLMNGAFEV